MIVQDIARPDVNGAPPKMKAIAEIILNIPHNIPHLSITCNDNLMSSIIIRGNFTPKDKWINNVYENGNYFILRIIPHNARYYHPDDSKITIESIITKGNKFRKYTGPVEKVIEKLQAWLSCTITR